MIHESQTNIVEILQVKSDRKPWTDKQENILDLMIAEMMRSQGYVNFSFLAKALDHSELSCETKAHRLSIEFTKKMPNENNMLRYNMRELPLHTRGDLMGKRVDYRL